MKYPTLNSWLGWSFDDVKYSSRTDTNSVYKFHINSDPVYYTTYKEELYNNARAMRDYFTGKFDVLLSGGIDSEVVVRTFKDLGISHNTFIFKYEKDYNYRDVSSAIELCKCLNISYTIIEFNLEKFFKDDAYDLFKKSRCIRAGRLPHLRFTDYLDNIPVMGEGEPYWCRELGSDYSQKSVWTFPMNESNHNCSMYLTQQGRENVCDWYEFTPALLKSFNYHPIIQNLIADKTTGKQSSWSARLPIHQEVWPDIVAKTKLIGYEQHLAPGTYPQFMKDMQQVMTSKIGNGSESWLTIEELDKLF